MNKEKSKLGIKKISVNLFIIMLVINIYISVINLSNAKFVTEKDTGAAATISKWDFKATDENSVDNVINIFINNGNVIVPGDFGEFDILINTKECEVDVEYKIKIIDSENMLPPNLKFYQIIEGEREYFKINEFGKETSVQSNQNSDIKKIYWEWELTDDHEEEFIGKTFKIDLQITGSNKIEV